LKIRRILFLFFGFQGEFRQFQMLRQPIQVCSPDRTAAKCDLGGRVLRERPYERTGVGTLTGTYSVALIYKKINSDQISVVGYFENSSA
jgi:hypothetical protein